MTLDANEIKLVWQKAEKVVGIAPNIYRKDPCGAWIAFNEFGNTNSSLGWQIDFISTDINLDKNSAENLYPLHCQNFISKPEGKLVCNVTTDWKKVNHMQKII